VPADRIVVLDGTGANALEALVQRGLRTEPAYVERRLAKGEAKRKIAFLSFSSGTTGKPKVALSLVQRRERN
jgi:4-coumarate--CoA ligase